MLGQERYPRLKQMPQKLISTPLHNIVSSLANNRVRFHQLLGMLQVMAAVTVMVMDVVLAGAEAVTIEEYGKTSL